MTTLHNNAFYLALLSISFSFNFYINSNVLLFWGFSPSLTTSESTQTRPATMATTLMSVETPSVTSKMTATAEIMPSKTLSASTQVSTSISPTIPTSAKKQVCYYCCCFFIIVSWYVRRFRRYYTVAKICEVYVPLESLIARHFSTGGWQRLAALQKPEMTLKFRGYSPL